jgi:hypothetical protein
MFTVAVSHACMRQSKTVPDANRYVSRTVSEQRKDSMHKRIETLIKIPVCLHCASAIVPLQHLAQNIRLVILRCDHIGSYYLDNQRVECRLSSRMRTVADSLYART